MSDSESNSDEDCAAVHAGYTLLPDNPLPDNDSSCSDADDAAAGPAELDSESDDAKEHHAGTDGPDGLADGLADPDETSKRIDEVENWSVELTSGLECELVD